MSVVGTNSKEHKWKKEGKTERILDLESRFKKKFLTVYLPMRRPFNHGGKVRFKVSLQFSIVKVLSQQTFCHSEGQSRQISCLKARQRQARKSSG